STYDWRPRDSDRRRESAPDGRLGGTRSRPSSAGEFIEFGWAICVARQHHRRIADAWKRNSVTPSSCTFPPGGEVNVLPQAPIRCANLTCLPHREMLSYPRRSPL